VVSAGAGDAAERGDAACIGAGDATRDGVRRSTDPEAGAADATGGVAGGRASSGATCGIANSTGSPGRNGCAMRWR
jgi:hypothetical protein